MVDATPKGGAVSEDPWADMTLSQLEAVAARLAKAVDTIKEARALLGGTAVAPTSGATPAAVPPTRVQWTPQELAIREQMAMQRDAAVAAQMPDDIARELGVK